MPSRIWSQKCQMSPFEGGMVLLILTNTQSIKKKKKKKGTLKRRTLANSLPQHP